MKANQSPIFWSLLLIIGLGTQYACIAEETTVHNSDWAYCTSIAVMDHFETIYLPHAQALMDAEKKLRDNASPASIIEKLSKLPGVKRAVIADNRISAKSGLDSVAVRLDSLLINDGRLYKSFKSPMMKKLLGGLCMWESFKLGDKREHCIVRGFYPVADDTMKKVAIALVLDRSWLIPQIPAIMDSLARENTQLLFWGPSPTNTIWAQTLGITAGKDTLWWQGPKDVKSEVNQVLWPFESIEIHSHLHKVTK